MHRARTIHTCVAAAGLAALVIALSGCSVFHPYVGPCYPDSKDAPSYASALTCAYSNQSAYSRRASEQGAITPVVGSLLIPLAGAAIGINAAGMSGDTLTYLGLGGATALTYGTFYHNAPRERAYLAGADAVDCVIRITRPYGVSAIDLSRFLTALDALDTALAQLKAIALPSDPNTPSVNELIEQAEVTLAQGFELRHKLQRVGGQMLDGLAKIRAAVNEAVRASEQDLPSLAKRLRASLPQSAQTYFDSGFQKPSDVPNVPPAERQRLRTALLTKALAAATEATRETDRRIEEVRDLVKRVKSFVDTIQLDGTSNLESCVTTLGGALQVDSMTVDPAALELSVNESKSFQIKGGRPPYSVQLLDDADAALTKQEPSSDRTVQITAKQTLGKYLVFVSDSDQRGATVKVTVK